MRDAWMQGTVSLVGENGMDKYWRKTMIIRGKIRKKMSGCEVSYDRICEENE